MLGVPVTTRIRQIEQPGEGYLPPFTFAEQQIVPDDSPYSFMYSRESLPGNIVGLAVDYLTRMALGDSPEDSFMISLLGANRINILDDKKDHVKIAENLVKGLKSNDPEEVVSSACQLVSYDVAVRANPKWFKPAEHNIPDPSTVYNILIMVNRMLYFNETVGPITEDGFTFEGGYTHIVSKGDGDFLTKDTIWDMKVLRSGITKDHTLQVLMYYLMGKESKHKFFDSISKLGLVNPRQNIYYLLEVENIDKKTIKEVKENVIGYT